jgi:hypothetical protein
MAPAVRLAVPQEIQGLTARGQTQQAQAVEALVQVAQAETAAHLEPAEAEAEVQDFTLETAAVDW